MSTVTFNALAPQSSVNQGFLSAAADHRGLAKFSRRGRLARTLVVLSLSVVMAAGFASRSGAGVQVVQSSSYLTVVVPAGESLWSVAAAYSDGDISAMLEVIREVNNLKGYDVEAGARLRIPVK